MIIQECSASEYQKLVSTPFSVFDTVDFAELNRHKVDEIKYLIFNDGKNRFGGIFGSKEGLLRAPFSAPYAGLSAISRDNKVIVYGETVRALVEYSQKAGFKRVRYTLAPEVYAPDDIAKFCNAFYVAGFRIAGCDLNFHYDVDSFTQDYEMSIDPKARQKLRSSMKNDLRFEKTADFQAVYEIIHENRKAKGYPLWMSLEDLLQTTRIVRADAFLVRDKDGLGVASALVYHVAPGKVQVIYWGNCPGTDELKPMNFLAFKTLEYYKSENISLFDVGPSTEFSVPNYGLCDFKQGVGCTVTTKFTFELDF